MWSEKERTNAVNRWWYSSPFYLWKRSKAGWLAIITLHPKIWSWSSVDFTDTGRPLAAPQPTDFSGTSEQNTVVQSFPGGHFTTVPAKVNRRHAGEIFSSPKIFVFDLFSSRKIVEKLLDK